jgi:hydroxymethylpyrimidine pyrophosphatase-like HAD family hydrolase
VLEIKTNKLLIDKPLLTSDALTAVQIIQSYGLFVSYFVGSEWYSEEGHEEFKWEQSILFKDAHIVEKLVDEVPPSPHKLLTIEFSDKRSLKSAYQALQETLPHINYNYARDIYFELYHPGADKANALAYLTGKMGVLADEVMAIGNGPNDLSMMSFAGLAVAVDNSPPELKSISAWTVASNDDDGVAQALEKILT